MIPMLDTLPERLREPVIERARELGYPTPDEYIVAVLEDALVEEVSADDDDDEPVDVIESIRQSLAEIKAGKFYELKSGADLRRLLDSGEFDE
jgi:hypothetical protein